MKKFLLSFFLIISAALLGSVVSAQGPTFHIPENAKRVSNNVYYLGKKTDPTTGKKVDGYMIVEHGKSGQARPDGVGGGPKSGGAVSCYGFLAKGAKWKRTPEPWIMNTVNNDNLDGNTLFTIMISSIGTWEAAAIIISSEEAQRLQVS